MGWAFQVVQYGVCAEADGCRGTCFRLLGPDFDALVDLGAGSVRRLCGLGQDWDRLSAVLLTHLHPDHALEVPYLVQLLVYGREAARTRPLYLYGSLPVAEALDAWASVFGAWVLGGPTFAVDCQVVGPGSELASPRGLGEDVVLKVGPVAHSPSSVAYRFEVQGAALVVTGDTGPDPDLAEFCRGAEVLVTECSFPDDRPVEGHLTPRAVSELAEAAGAGIVVLGHFYPGTDSRAAVEEVAERTGAIVVPADSGLTLELRDGNWKLPAGSPDRSTTRDMEGVS